MGAKMKRSKTEISWMILSYCCCLAVSSAGVAVIPDFAEPIRNVTVPLGREAILSCVINDLAEYKVGWLRADDQTILSLHRRVVTHNPRVSVTHDESRTWNLHIRQIKESDQGCYMCQINTATMKKQLGCIQVQVPPDIMDDASTSDVTVNEGDNVTLTCVAKGKPAPRIVWRREDGQKIIVPRTASSSKSTWPTGNSNKGGSGGVTPASGLVNEVTGSLSITKPTPKTLEWAATLNDQVLAPQHYTTNTRERTKEVEAYHGEVLRLYRVTRTMMGAYMCVANNGVPPAVSKRVPLNVNFSPVVSATMNVVGAPVGSDIRLRCVVESYPPSINFWMKGRHQDHSIILTSAKYGLEEDRNSGYQTNMTLTIRDFRSEDKSAYICVATNSLGSAESSIQVYEVVKAISSTTRPWFPSTAVQTSGPRSTAGNLGSSWVDDEQDGRISRKPSENKHRHHETSSTQPPISGRNARMGSSAPSSFSPSFHWSLLILAPLILL